MAGQRRVLLVRRGSLATVVEVCDGIAVHLLPAEHVYMRTLRALLGCVVEVSLQRMLRLLLASPLRVASLSVRLCLFLDRVETLFLFFCCQRRVLGLITDCGRKAS